jgi:hypothetical protein
MNLLNIQVLEATDFGPNGQNPPGKTLNTVLEF